MGAEGSGLLGSRVQGFGPFFLAWPAAMPAADDIAQPRWIYVSMVPRAEFRMARHTYNREWVLAGLGAKGMFFVQVGRDQVLFEGQG